MVIEGTSFSADPKVYLTTPDEVTMLLTDCPERGHRAVACLTTAVSGDIYIVVGDTIQSNTAYYDSSEPMVVKVELSTGVPRTVGGAVLEIVAQGLGTDIGDISAYVGGNVCAVCAN